MDLTPLKRTSLMYSPVKNLTLVKANCSPFPVVGSGGGRHKIMPTGFSLYLLSQATNGHPNPLRNPRLILVSIAITLQDA